MPVGALVAIPELQSEGVARLTAEQGGNSTIRFLTTGAVKTQESRQVSRYALLPGTRVTVAVSGAAPRAAHILPQGIQRDATSGLLVYGVRYEDGVETRIREDAIASVTIPSDPLEQLATATFHDLRPAHGTRSPPEPWGPPIFSAREELLAWRDSAWSGTGGVVSLAGARVRPLPHQLLTARRVLADRQIRFLLADEVGLGKTIEAGLVMQSLLAMQPTLRVLVVVPGALVSQWFLELFVKFGGRPFLMLDSERLQTHPGNPWKDEQFVIASNRALEELDNKGALRVAQSQWDLLVVDECHRMQPHGVLYKRVSLLSRHSPHVLLLSATPARQHPDAYLALLALLQPQVYRVDDHEGFAAKLAAHDRVVELLGRTRDATVDGLRALAPAWKALLGADPLLAARAEALSAAGDDSALEAARASVMAHVREHHQLDHRIVRHRRHVLARLSQATGVAGLTMAVRTVERVGYTLDKAEASVREQFAAYRAALMSPYAGAVTAMDVAPTDSAAADGDSTVGGNSAAGGSPAAGGKKKRKPKLAEAAASTEAAEAQAGGTGPREIPPRLAHWLLQVELAVGAHPRVLERLLAMRATVLADPEEFAEYRDRALTGETLSQVLRNDLSENEITAHVAVSAACHCDNPDETPALEALRAAAAAWGKKVPSRDKALIKRLEEFWIEHPQEKVLIFTNHGLTVAPLEQALIETFGEHAIETFGAHQDTVAREEAARRFRDDARCWAMVCDPLGGEGRNFQFVSVVAHHDLPWSIAGVEQRIGRVDRIGRDGDVPSWVIAGDSPECVDAAWADILERAVGVFTGPSSGLEFVTDAIEARSLAATLAAGAEALRAIEPELAGIVARERATADRREEELFQQETGVFAEAAKLAQAIDTAQAPVEAVLRWLRGMGGSARRDDESHKLFHLRARHNDKPDHGTLDRQLALSRPELAFFAVGNGLVDRTLDDAAGARWCAAQAWRRKAARGVAAWEGVRVVFALGYDLGAVLAAELRLESLRRLFLIAPPSRISVCVRGDGAVETDPEALALLAPGFDVRNGDTTISQGASRDAWARPMVAGPLDQVTRWQDRVRLAGAAAIRHAEASLPAMRDAQLARLEAGFAESVAVARGQAAAAEAALGPSHAETLRAQAEALDEERQAGALSAALAGARLEMSSISYVVVA